MAREAALFEFTYARYLLCVLYLVFHLASVIWSAVFVARTLPILECPYPVLVLVGPQGVGKKSLAQKLAEDLPDYFGYA